MCIRIDEVVLVFICFTYFPHPFLNLFFIPTYLPILYFIYLFIIGCYRRRRCCYRTIQSRYNSRLHLYQWKHIK
jgi:hypothetical protein